MRTRVWARTDTGNVRVNNEDSFLADGDQGVFAVADGVGGKEAGELASEALVTQVRSVASQIQTLAGQGDPNADPAHREAVFRALVQCVQHANAQIYSLGLDPSYNGGMATTADVVLLSNWAAYIAHVGDSRVYLMRDDKIFRITKDHTFAEHLRAQSQLRPELVPMIDRYNHVLTRSVGSKPHVNVDTLFVEIEHGDRLLMCSDGLSDYLSGAEIRDFIVKRSQQDLVDALVDEANSRGGKDNITVVLVEVTDPDVTVVSRAPARLDTMRKVDLLEDVELFEGLTPQELLKVLRIVFERQFQDSETMIRRGEPVDGLYLIVDGAASLSVGEHWLGALEAGQHFGELALFGDPLRSADVRSKGSSRVLVLPAALFRELVTDDPILGNKLLWNLLSRAATYTQNMADEIFEKT